MLCGSTPTQSNTQTDVAFSTHPVAGRCCFRCLFVWIAVAVIAYVVLLRK